MDEFVIEVGGSLILVKMTTALMGLAVIAPVSLQIVIERNVLMEKCLSSRSVGMSKICACPRVPVEDPCQFRYFWVTCNECSNTSS